MHLREILTTCPYVCRHSLQRCRQVCLKFRWFLILHIKHRSHLIAIFRIKSSCRKVHLSHHIWIDKTQPLLLSCSHKQWSIHLYSIHIHTIFIVITSSHRVLRTHLVVRTNSCKCCQQTLDIPPRCIWHQSQTLAIQGHHR